MRHKNETLHLIPSGEVPRGVKMLYSGTGAKSCITENTLVFKDKGVTRVQMKESSLHL